jgi:hypothetical protein
LALWIAKAGDPSHMHAVLHHVMTGMCLCLPPDAARAGMGMLLWCSCCCPSLMQSTYAALASAAPHHYRRHKQHTTQHVWRCCRHTWGASSSRSAMWPWPSMDTTSLQGPRVATVAAHRGHTPVLPHNRLHALLWCIDHVCKWAERATSHTKAEPLGISMQTPG